MLKFFRKITLALALLTPSAALAAPSADAVPAQSQTQSRKVDLNKADQAELESLPLIGPAKAKAILEDRAKNGPFKTLAELMRVDGIGPKTIERLRGLVVQE